MIGKRLSDAVREQKAIDADRADEDFLRGSGWQKQEDNTWLKRNVVVSNAAESITELPSPIPSYSVDGNVVPSGVSKVDEFTGPEPTSAPSGQEEPADSATPVTPVDPGGEPAIEQPTDDDSKASKKGK